MPAELPTPVSRSLYWISVLSTVRSSVLARSCGRMVLADSRPWRHSSRNSSAAVFGLGSGLATTTGSFTGFLGMGLGFEPHAATSAVPASTQDRLIAGVLARLQLCSEY